MLPIASRPEWWEPWLDFATTPAEIVPAGIAIAALLLGIVNLVRSFGSRTLPRLQTSVRVAEDWEISTYPDDDGNPFDVQRMTFTVRNHGGAAAHDVRVGLPTKGSAPQVQELGMLKPDESGNAVFNILDEGVEWKGYAELSWWEYPPGRQQKRRLAYP
jgi:hypothetical protein